MLLTQSRSPSRDIDRLFQTFFGAPGVGSGPPADLWEDERAAQLTLEVPGWRMDQLELTVKQDVIRVRGQREADETTPTRWIRRERSAAAFDRAFHLPFEIDVAKVEATLQDGVLHVTLPKAENTLPRRIEVRGGSAR